MDCFLVIPCFYESDRVPAFLAELCEAISESGLLVGVQLVDDGSDPAEVERLRSVVARCRNSYPFVSEVFALGRNRGKGAAIRSGWSLAADNTRVLGFVDADGSVSAEETLRVLREALAQSEPFLVVASRSVSGSKVNRSLRRKLLAVAFSILVRVRYSIRIKDTQCGCKFVDAAWFRDCGRDLSEDGFGLDVELILKARERGCSLQEIGIGWVEKEGSKVGFAGVWSLFKSIALRRIGS